MSQRYFATTLPGLEEALLMEIRALRCKRPSVLVGGVEFEASRRGAYEALHTLRSAHRLLLRLDDFRAGDLFTLHRKAERFDWSAYLPAGCSLRLHTTAQNTRLASVDAIEESFFAGIRDHFLAKKNRPPVLLEDKPKAVQKGTGAKNTQETTEDDEEGEREAQPMEFGVWLRLEENRCYVSLDCGGFLLYRRGWRAQIGAAPIRESIASALLLLSGWQPHQPLLDPMCGVGTFLIEAARIQRGLPPRLDDKTILHRSPFFDAVTWESMIAQPLSFPKLWQGQQGREGLLWGADRDSATLEKAKQNAKMASVSEGVSFLEQSLDAFAPPTEEKGIILTNPPYGSRLSHDEEGRIERALLEGFAKRFQGWQLFLVLPRQITPHHKALQAEEIARFRNGGLPVRFWRIQHKNNG